MPPRPNPETILAVDPDRHGPELWNTLAPERWPLPLERLPPGTALVGGAVRDALLGRLGERPDLDLVVPQDAVPLTRELASSLGGSCVVLDAERSIARLVIHGWTIDLARRAGESLIEDLGRRDFSINAMAIPLAGDTACSFEDPAARAVLVDPCGGMDDLRNRRIDAISEANLLADPLRLLRGIRLATELDFNLTATTWQLIGTHQGRIAEVAGERVLAEVLRVSEAPLGGRGLSQAIHLGLLRPWGVMSCPPDGEARQRLLERLNPDRVRAVGLTRQEAARALPLARLALILDGEALEHLPASRILRRRCLCLWHWWRRLCPPPPDAAIAVEQLPEVERLRLQRDLEADWPALLLLLSPDQLPDGALGRWRDGEDPLFHPRAPLDGLRLQEGLGIGPGPQLGRLMEHLTLELAFGRLPQGQDSGRVVLRTARRWLEREAMRHD